MGRKRRGGSKSEGSGQALSGGASRHSSARSSKIMLDDVDRLAHPEDELPYFDVSLCVVLLLAVLVQHYNVVGVNWWTMGNRALILLVALSLAEDYFQRWHDAYAPPLSEAAAATAEDDGEPAAVPLTLQASKLVSGVVQIVLIWKLFQEFPLQTVLALAPLLHETLPQLAALFTPSDDAAAESGTDTFTTASAWWAARFAELVARSAVLSYTVAVLPMMFLRTEPSYDKWRAWALVYLTFVNVLLLSTLLLIVSHGQRLRELAQLGGHWRSVFVGGDSSNNAPAAGSSSSATGEIASAADGIKEWDPQHVGPYEGGATVRHAGRCFQADGKENRCEPGKLAPAVLFIAFDDPTLAHLVMTGIATANVALVGLMMARRPWAIQYSWPSMVSQLIVLWCCVKAREVTCERLVKTTPLGPLSLRSVYR